MVKLRIKVNPGARCNAVIAPQSPDGLTIVAVTAVAEGGKANAAVCKTLAKWAQVPKSSVTVISGHAARIKTVEFATLDLLPVAPDLTFLVTTPI
jgi:uncharacterized protein YggU (UPF0235/DUF167 family)